MVHINPIFPYPSYVPDKPPSNPAEGAGSAAFKNNPPAISRELQADILDIKKGIVNPLERLGADVNNLDLKVNNKYPALRANDDFSAVKTTLGALSPFPTFRRVMSVPDAVNDENWGRAAGTLGLAALNMPADLRDSVKLGMAELSSIKNGTGPIKVQVNQNFLGGTLLNEWRDKSKWLDKVLKSVDKYDNTLSDTKFGEWVKDKLKINSKLASFSSGKNTLYGQTFEGNIFQKTAGCSLIRVSIIGVALSSLFEIPALYNAATVEGDTSTKAKSFTKQLCKSGSFIGLNTIAIAAAGGLAMAAGMGVLAALGLSAVGAAFALWGSNTLNKQIDKLFA